MGLYTDPTTVNMSDPVNIFQYVGNVTTMGIFNVYDMLLWVVCIGVIIATGKSTDDFALGLSIGTFILFVLGLFAWLGGLISGFMLSIYIGLAIVGILAYLSQ